MASEGEVNMDHEPSLRGPVEVDWTKPIQFRNGEPCELLEIWPEGSPNFPDKTHVIRRIGVDEPMASVWWLNADGKHLGLAGSDYDVINCPQDNRKDGSSKPTLPNPNGG